MQSKYMTEFLNNECEGEGEFKVKTFLKSENTELIDLESEDEKVLSQTFLTRRSLERIC